MKYVIKAAKLFDSINASVIENVEVHIENGKICNICKIDENAKYDC